MTRRLNGKPHPKAAPEPRWPVEPEVDVVLTYPGPYGRDVYSYARVESIRESPGVPALRIPQVTITVRHHSTRLEFVYDRATGGWKPGPQTPKNMRLWRVEEFQASRGEK